MTRSEFAAIKPIIHLGEEELKENDFDTFFRIIKPKATKYQFADIYMFFVDVLHMDPLSYMSVIPAGFFTNIPAEVLVIPSNIRTIEAGAFRGNPYLEKVEFAATSPITDIPDNCFANCRSLKEIYLGRQTDYLGADAFANCADNFQIYVSPAKMSTFTVDGELEDYRGHLKKGTA